MSTQNLDGAMKSLGETLIAVDSPKRDQDIAEFDRSTAEMESGVVLRKYTTDHGKLLREAVRQVVNTAQNEKWTPAERQRRAVETIAAHIGRAFKWHVTDREIGAVQRAVLSHGPKATLGAAESIVQEGASGTIRNPWGCLQYRAAECNAKPTAATSTSKPKARPRPNRPTDALAAGEVAEQLLGATNE